MSRPSTEHLPPSVLNDYQARRLAPSEVLAASDHLAECAACRQELARLAAGGRAAQAMDFVEIPSNGLPAFSELAACLDGELDAVQTAELHRRVEAEPFLASALADLEAFRRESATLVPRVFGPAGAGAQNTAGNEKPAPVPAVPLRDKIVAFPLRRWAALAAAAMVVAYVSWQMVFPGQKHLARQLWGGSDGSPVALDELPAGLRGAVERAAATGELTPPASLSVLRPATGTLAGQAPLPAAFAQISPVGEAVRETNPPLRWTACPGAVGYVVYLVPIDTPEAVQRQELPGDRTYWTPPEPLARGAVYEWQVEARADDGRIIDRSPKPPEPEARFVVLSDAALDELKDLERRFPHASLVLGTAYLRAGLTRDAAAQFRELARTHPDSAAARRLVTQGRDGSPSRP